MNEREAAPGGGRSEESFPDGETRECEVGYRSLSIQLEWKKAGGREEHKMVKIVRDFYTNVTSVGNE